MRWLLVPIAALVGMLAFVAPGNAQTQLSSEAFLDRLHRARELARLDGEGPSPKRMTDVRAALGLPVEIIIGDWSVTMGPDPMLDGLSGENAGDFQRAGERIAALERSLTAALSREAPPSDRIAQALADAYRGVVTPRPNLPEIVLRIVAEVVQGIVQRIGGLVAGAGSALAWIALVAIGVFAAVFLLRPGLVPDRVSRRAATGRGATGSVDWAARADEALRAGDLHEAVRALYLALLAVLARRGIVADAPALTAGEARFAVRRARPTLFSEIARATESYERVIYGGATPDERDIEQLRAATTKVRMS